MHDLTKKPETLNQCPYNSVVVQNFSTQKIHVAYGDSSWYVPPQSSLCDPQAYGTRILTFTNADSVANDDLIHVVVSRIVDSDAALVADICDLNIFDVANGLK